MQRFFGNKSDRDIKGLLPRVEEINQFVAAYGALSHDELRAKTQEFKSRIEEGLSEFNRKLDALRRTPSAPSADAASGDGGVGHCGRR